MTKVNLFYAYVCGCIGGEKEEENAYNQYEQTSKGKWKGSGRLAEQAEEKSKEKVWNWDNEI